MAIKTTKLDSTEEQLVGEIATTLADAFGLPVVDDGTLPSIKEYIQAVGGDYQAILAELDEMRPELAKAKEDAKTIMDDYQDLGHVHAKMMDQVDDLKAVVVWMFNRECPWWRDGQWAPLVRKDGRCLCDPDKMWRHMKWSKLLAAKEEQD